MILLLLGALLLIPVSQEAKILETNRLDMVWDLCTEEVVEDTLVICDLDNTLMQGAQQLGSVAWRKHLITSLRQKGISEQEAEQIQDILWKTIQPKMKVKMVDTHTSKIIDRLQTDGIVVIAMTARYPYEEEYTHRQIHSIGVDFNKQAFIPEEKIDLPLQKESCFDKGVLFCTPYNNRANVLLALLEKIDYHPQRVIFIDDEWINVREMERALEVKGISCTSIRFGGADTSMKEYNPEIAEIQWRLFPLYISDEDAKRVKTPSLSYSSY